MAICDGVSEHVGRCLADGERLRRAEVRLEAVASVGHGSLANLTLGLAKELAPQVTVNGIAPGVVEWPDDYPEADRQKYLKRVPLQRAGTPEDVANLVHYLANEGSYITGQIIRLDGGRSIT